MQETGNTWENQKFKAQVTIQSYHLTIKMCHVKIQTAHQIATKELDPTNHK